MYYILEDMYILSNIMKHVDNIVMLHREVTYSM